MKRDILLTAGGTILGSLIQEGIEELFPGAGELGATGEIAGAISGFLSSQLTKEELRNALESFIKYSYRQMNKTKAPEDISEKELQTFSDNFSKLPKNKKAEIINNFKNLAPYEYSFIMDFLEGIQAQTAEA